MLAPLLLIIKLIFGGLLGAGIGLFMAKSLRITLGAVFISYWLIFVWDDNGPLVTLGTDITFYEVLGGLALLALIVRIKLLGKKVRRNKTLSIILFFLVAGELVTIFTSVFKFGLSTLSIYKPAITYVILLLLFYSFDVSRKDFIAAFKWLAFYSAITILLVPIRIFGILEMPIAVRDAGSWEGYRYIINYQSLYLVFFVLAFLIIAINRKKDLGIFSTALFALTVPVVVLIPQRMVWILFALSIFYLVAVYRARISPKIFTGVGIAAGILLILIQLPQLEDFLFVTKASLFNPFELFFESNAGYRFFDNIVMTQQVISQGKTLTGLGIQAAIGREVLGHYMEYPVHNYIVYKFVQGGLSLAVPHLLLMLYLVFKLRRFSDPRFPDFYVQILWLSVSCMFLFSLTTFGGPHMVIPLGLALSLLSTKLPVRADVDVRP